MGEYVLWGTQNKSQQHYLHSSLIKVSQELRKGVVVVVAVVVRNGRRWSLGSREEQGPVRPRRDEDRLGRFSPCFWALRSDFSPCCQRSGEYPLQFLFQPVWLTFKCSTLTCFWIWELAFECSLCFLPTSKSKILAVKYVIFSYVPVGTCCSMLLLPALLSNFSLV